MIPDNEIIIEDDFIASEDEAMLQHIIFGLLPKEPNER